MDKSKWIGIIFKLTLYTLRNEEPAIPFEVGIVSMIVWWRGHIFPTTVNLNLQIYQLVRKLQVLFGQVHTGWRWMRGRLVIFRYVKILKWKVDNNTQLKLSAIMNTFILCTLHILSQINNIWHTSIFILFFSNSFLIMFKKFPFPWWSGPKTLRFTACTYLLHAFAHCGTLFSNHKPQIVRESPANSLHHKPQVAPN